MILLTLLCIIISTFFILGFIRLILIYIVFKYGKFSYDGFNSLGFAYDSKKDIFYSVKNAWQKKFGYSHLYDVGAPLFNIIMDAEPIHFFYDNKNWLITFWKGQYGMVTGAEIGIYYTDQKVVNKNTIYKPAEKKDRLDMTFLLYKKDKLIARVSDKHWWLTAFKLGMFSNPRDLSMDINITFKDRLMLESFLSSFRKLNHSKNSYKAIDNTFCFLYKKPHTKAPWTRFWLADTIRQAINHHNINLYNKYLDDLIEKDHIDDSKLNKQKVILINDLIPTILKNPKTPHKGDQHRE